MILAEISPIDADVESRFRIRPPIFAQTRLPTSSHANQDRRRPVPMPPVAMRPIRLRRTRSSRISARRSGVALALSDGPDRGLAVRFVSGD